MKKAVTFLKKSNQKTFGLLGVVWRLLGRLNGKAMDRKAGVDGRFRGHDVERVEGYLRIVGRAGWFKRHRPRLAEVFWLLFFKKVTACFAYPSSRPMTRAV